MGVFAECGAQDHEAVITTGPPLKANCNYDMFDDIKHYVLAFFRNDYFWLTYIKFLGQREKAAHVLATENNTDSITTRQLIETRRPSS